MCPYFVDGCTDQFEDWNGNSDYCYQSVPDGKSFYDAQDFCNSIGDDLAIVHSESTMNSIIAHTQEAAQSMWIGLKKDQLEGSKINYNKAKNSDL